MLKRACASVHVVLECGVNGSNNTMRFSSAFTNSFCMNVPPSQEFKEKTAPQCEKG